MNIFFNIFHHSSGHSPLISIVINKSLSNYIFFSRCPTQISRYRISFVPELSGWVRKEGYNIKWKNTAWSGINWLYILRRHITFPHNREADWVFNKAVGPCWMMPSRNNVPAHGTTSWQLSWLYGRTSTVFQTSARSAGEIEKCHSWPSPGCFEVAPHLLPETLLLNICLVSLVVWVRHCHKWKWHPHSTLLPVCVGWLQVTAVTWHDTEQSTRSACTSTANQFCKCLAIALAITQPYIKVVNLASRY